jgi:hypothetical protein
MVFHNLSRRAAGPLGIRKAAPEARKNVAHGASRGAAGRPKGLFSEPRLGRQNRSMNDIGFFRPSRGWPSAASLVPTACAVGHILPPLRGCRAGRRPGTSYSLKNHQACRNTVPGWRVKRLCDNLTVAAVSPSPRPMFQRLRRSETAATTTASRLSHRHLSRWGPFVSGPEGYGKTLATLRRQG